ncbi:MAG: NAD(P)/FAD-dependent oxidoreductase [Chthoniobacterales bacterium]
MKTVTREDLNSDSNNLPVVIIIGGGFGGLSAAKAFAGKAVRVVLIDRSNHHLFQPLLYQVATAGLSPADIAEPIRRVLRNQKNATVVLGEVSEIRPDKHEVVSEDLIFQYDYLIVAAGTRHSYFGNDAWEKFAPGMKSLEDALTIRRRVLLAFERAEKTDDEAERQAIMTFVIVGAGPTGVEMAGAISELARFTLKKDFRRINPADARIILVEAGPRVLAAFSPESSKRTVKNLKKMHIEVRLGTPVSDITATELKIGDKETIPTHTVIWAAGNAASPLAGMLDAETDRQGRVVVNSDLSIKDHPEIFAVGDMCSAKYDKNKPVPGVSPAALQGGRHAAANILSKIAGKPTKEWHYFDKGSMATIGRHAAVCEIGPLKFGGLLAWLAWAFVHLFFLVSFRSRSAVFIEWIWAYFTYGRGARLISESGKKRIKPEK